MALYRETVETPAITLSASDWITYARLLVAQRQLDRLAYAIAEQTSTVVAMAETVGGGWQDTTVIKLCHQLDTWERRREALVMERDGYRTQLTNGMRV